MAITGHEDAASAGSHALTPTSAVRWCHRVPVLETRGVSSKFSQKVLNNLAKVLPEIVGGSADLTGSNYTNLDCSFDFQKATPAGRYLRFGVREHGTGAAAAATTPARARGGGAGEHG